MMKVYLYWRRLIISPAKRNELLSMELSWLGNLRTGREIVEITRAKDLSVVFLAETLTDDARLEIVQRSIEHDH